MGTSMLTRRPAVISPKVDRRAVSDETQTTKPSPPISSADKQAPSTLTDPPATTWPAALGARTESRPDVVAMTSPTSTMNPVYMARPPHTGRQPADRPAIRGVSPRGPGVAPGRPH